MSPARNLHNCCIRKCAKPFHMESNLLTLVKISGIYRESIGNTSMPRPSPAPPRGGKPSPEIDFDTYKYGAAVSISLRG